MSRTSAVAETGVPVRDDVDSGDDDNADDAETTAKLRYILRAVAERCPMIIREVISLFAYDTFYMMVFTFCEA